MSLRPTAELIREASQGHPAAIDELMTRHLPGLHAFIRLRAGRAILDKETPSDILQSVCREVLERVNQFRYGGEAGFKHWLYTTALRKLANRDEYYKAAKRDTRREQRLAGTAATSLDAILGCYSSFSSPSQHAIAYEELQRIEAAFAKLSEDHREVIVLAKVCGLSRAELAKEMGRSEVAVRSLLSRALAQLADYLN